MYCYAMHVSSVILNVIYNGNNYKTTTIIIREFSAHELLYAIAVIIDIFIVILIKFSQSIIIKINITFCT